MKKPKIGLLPFYIRQYDEWSRDNRKPIAAHIKAVSGGLRKVGVDVEVGEVCTVARQFAAQVGRFEKSGVDALVTLHLAYSQSLESSRVLAKTGLPIIVLDTTPDMAFGPNQNPAKIMANHGIHGVQDMCNMLIRNGKDFEIEAGHWKSSDVLKRVAIQAKGAQAVKKMRSMRVGRIGKAFAGMGDFSVPPAVLKRALGVTVVESTHRAVAQLMPGGKASEVTREIAEDSKTFNTSKVAPRLHNLSVRAGLAVRKWIEKNRLSAFSINFLDVKKSGKLPIMPFLEASKAMARGTGYAGEGDVLTASLVSALNEIGSTTFTEMFCPDWKGNRVFLCHMGEVNVSLTSGKPVLFERKWIFTDAEDTVMAAAALKPGKAVYVNLAPMSQGRFALIVSPVKMMAAGKADRFKENVRGWMRPPIPINDYLAQYSRLGGTHHSALVYGDVQAEIEAFGVQMGWDVFVIE